MNNSFKIISKQEFTSLYRFSYIPYDSIRVIFAQDEDKEFENNLFNSFTSLPQFEGDEEYLILKFNTKDKDQKIISIRDVLEVIPLTRSAKRSYEIKFDPRINFSVPRFENIVQNIEKKIDIRDRIEGAKALVRMLVPEIENIDFISNQIIESAYNARVEGKKSSEILEDFYTHLLVYERYDFFPNNDYGYFYDIGEVFANSKGKHTFKGSGFYNYLEKNKFALKEQKISKIIKDIEESEEILPFKDQLLQNNVRLYLSSAFYLKFKDELLSKDSIYDTKIPEITNWILNNNNYHRELFDSLYLLGAFFGYKKFYDDYYNTLNLSFFKNQTKSNLIVNRIDHNNEEVPLNTPVKLEQNNLLEENIITKNEITDQNSDLIENLENSITEITPSILLENFEQNNSLEENNESNNEIANENSDINDVDIVIEKSNQLKEEEIAEVNHKEYIITSILEKIKGLASETLSGELKMEKETLNELIKIFAQIADSKKLTKDKILDLIQKEFKDEIEIPKKYTLKIKNNKLNK